MLRHARADDSGQASSLPAVWVQMGAEALAAAMLCQMQVPRLEHAPPTEQAAHPAAMSPADVGAWKDWLARGRERVGRRREWVGKDRAAHCTDRSGQAGGRAGMGQAGSVRLAEGWATQGEDGEWDGVGRKGWRVVRRGKGRLAEGPAREGWAGGR